VVDLLFLLAYGTDAQPKVCGNKYSGRHERGRLFYPRVRVEGNCGTVMYFELEVLFHLPAPLELAEI